jgi:hypothetical protein
MAHPRPVIKAILDANCKNCIYSRQGREKYYCARKFHANIGYECEAGDWCGQGVWTTQREGGDVIARGLEELYEYEWEDK